MLTFNPYPTHPWPGNHYVPAGAPNHYWPNPLRRGICPTCGRCLDCGSDHRCSRPYPYQPIRPYTITYDTEYRGVETDNGITVNSR